jgi:hypothetical protein
MKLSEDAKQKLSEIKSRYVEDTNNLLLNEARKYNPYKVGDIIEDHYQIGKIKSVVINTNVDRRTYSIYYKCERLTKKLKPYKSGEIIVIYRINVKQKISKWIA